MVLVATQVKRRRGTTAENDAFTGAEGEITVDIEKHELRVHDGTTQGGHIIPTNETLDFANKALDNLSQAGEARFTNKANTDLSNIPSNIDYVVEKQEPTSGNGYTWYRKYKSGWVEQGGRTSNFTNTGQSTGESKTVILPIAMSDTYYTVNASLCSDLSLGNGSVSGWANRDIKPGIMTTTGFTMEQWANNASSGTSVIACWQVSGMSAQ